MASLMDRTKTNFWRLSMKGLPRGANVTRYYMYEHLKAFGASLPDLSGDVLSISDSTRLCKEFGLNPASIVEADYPEHNLMSLKFPDESFDFVVSDQVLEHVEGNPQLAFDETWRVLRPGGIALHTSVFIYRLHDWGMTGDYWRFSAEGLRLLTGKFSRVLDYGAWGNVKASRLLDTELRYVALPRSKWHPLHRVATENDKDWPIVTWIVVQK
jgi:SAM-dependent methyltransferase